MIEGLDNRDMQRINGVTSGGVIHIIEFSPLIDRNRIYLEDSVMGNPLELRIDGVHTDGRVHQVIVRFVRLTVNQLKTVDGVRFVA